MEDKGVLRMLILYRFFGIIFTGLLFVALAWKIAAGAEFTDFGPYQGKVIDAETKEPIEGVVVLIEWVKLHAFAGSTFIDAQETLTDKNGEFYIPGIWVFNPWKSLTSEALMTIYKSGYQSPNTGAWKKWKVFRPKLEYVLKVEDGKPVIMLKKLTDPEERGNNIPGEPSVPDGKYHQLKKKWKLLRLEKNKELRALGLKELIDSDQFGR